MADREVSATTCAVLGCGDEGRPQYKHVWINLGGVYHPLDPVPLLVLCYGHLPKDGNE